MRPLLLSFAIACAAIAHAQGMGRITENIDLGRFTLLPDPAQDQVTLMPEHADVHLFVLFYDLQGRNVLSADMTGPLTIDVTGLPDGAYMVSTVNDRGTPLDVHRLLIAH